MARHLESKLQIFCVKWFRLQYPTKVLIAIPNGGLRGKIEAGIMKAEGMYAGASDLFLFAPSGIYHGLCIEFKTDKGKQTESQRIFEMKVRVEGYKYVICRSFEDFKSEITNYLNPKK